MQEMIDRISDKIKVSFKPDGCRKYFDDDKDPRNCYIVTVKYDGKQCSFTYGDSIADTIERNAPKPEDIFYIIVSDYNLTKENYPDYVDFAREFGYNEDSIKGLKTYEKCLIQGDKLHKVFNDEDIKTLDQEMGQ